MAPPPDRFRNPQARRRRGFQQAAILLADRVQKAAEGRGFAVSRLLTHWPEIAGPQLAAMTRPVRVSHARGGFGATLTLLTAGPVAPLVEMQLPQLRDRVNACYGYNAVQRIVLTQTAATGFAEGRAVFASASPVKAAAPEPQVLEQANHVARQFQDPALAQAMAMLATNIATKRHRTHRKDFPC
ncbi:DUF721 domain-containing protein [Paracoccus sediminis]|uniref:DUF721 domain-containing protein n=1 Tax=Paracoccus sediminis TaxID=1214787 RepID=A0A238VP81_9RHOB|nr:DUF721 domain-containing protein [Paracoccus sediminis]TBN52367.1 DUF721 domain-containing protein [Paracoccus sediminis]SNR35573.1 hypothetical protein SAMN06265378_102456 [Paracoccus sediminis]